MSQPFITKKIGSLFSSLSQSRHWVAIAGALILVMLIMGALSFFKSRSQKNWVPLKRGQIIEAVYGVGTVVSDNIFEHRQAVISAVKELKVKEGDFVRSGQTLLVFDEGQTVKSPFDGVVTALPYHAQETVAPQSVVIRIEDLINRHVEVGLEQRGAIRVQRGQNVKMSFESLRGHSYNGVVQAIFPTQGQFTVRVALKDQIPASLLPGMTADVSIEVSQKDQALLVPIAAISAGRVIKKRGAGQEKVPIQMGLKDENFAEVIDGEIQIGDEVLVPLKAR